MGVSSVFPLRLKGLSNGLEEAIASSSVVLRLEAVWWSYLRF